MKYLILLTSTALTLSVGCLKSQEEETPSITVNPPTSDNPSVDWDKERQLVVQAPIPGTFTIKDQQPLNARYTLTADNAGKLLVRVREPLLVTDPQQQSSETN